MRVQTFVLLACACALAGPARGDEAPSEGAPPPPVPAVAPAPAPVVPLERLMKLPTGFTPKVEKRRGGGEAEWRERFRTAREELERSRAALSRSKQELSELASSSDAWTLAPPVGGASQMAADAPLDYQLRQRMNRERDAVARAEKGLRDLEVEANLAGVPEAWRR